MTGSTSYEDETTTNSQIDELSRPAYIPRAKTAYPKLPDNDRKALQALVETLKAKRSSTVKVSREAPDNTSETLKAVHGNIFTNNPQETPDETRETLTALARVLNTKAIEDSNKSTEAIHDAPDETRETLRALARVLNTKSAMASKSEWEALGTPLGEIIAQKRKEQAPLRKELRKLENASDTPEGKIEEIKDKILNLDIEINKIGLIRAPNKNSGSGSGSGPGGFDDSGLGSSRLSDEFGAGKKPNATSSPTKDSGQPTDEFNESSMFNSTGLGNTSSGSNNDNEADGLFVPKLPQPKSNFPATGNESEDDFQSVQGSEAGGGAGDESSPQEPENATGACNESNVNATPKDEHASLFTPEQADKAAGRRSDGVVTHWRKQGNANHVIVRYGPLNARKYTHTTSSRAGKNFDKKNTPKFGPAFRYGDKKDEDGNYLRSRDEFQGFLGEAYTGNLKGLRPKKEWKDSKGNKRTEKRKFPITDLYVQWMIGGELKWAMETRSSIKHLWTSPRDLDTDIYNSAKFHYEQHQKWLNAQDRATGEDGDEGDEDVDEESDESNDGSDKETDESNDGSDEETDGDGSDVASERSMEETRSRNKGKGKKAKGKGGKAKSKGEKAKGKNTAPDDDIKKMLRYQKRWCALKGVKPKEMTPKHESEFLQVWELISSKDA